jgi:hypothetical protein
LFPSALTCEASAAAFPAVLFIVSDASSLREPPNLVKALDEEEEVVLPSG